MKPIFRATAILSGSSIISILLSLISAKIMALYLQPAGYGYYGVLQSFIGLAALIGGMGMATGIVRMGAAAATQNDQATLANLRRGSWMVFAGVALVSVVVLALFRMRLSEWVLGDPNHATTMLLMSIALLFTVAGNIQSGILNACHRVGALAKYGVANTVLGAAVSIAAVLIWGVRGVVFAVIAGAFVSWVASRYFLQREIPAVAVKPALPEVLQQASSLLRFGVPYTASMLVGSGVRLALPILVLHLLSTESVGYYKAAAAISVGYLGFLITAMAQDYYPRVSAVADQPDSLAILVNEQHRLVMMVALPMVLGTLALVPYLVPLVYSRQFLPAVDILEWQLIGDIFKFSSWTMSFVILARCNSFTYFCTEAIGGLTTIISTWFAVRWFGLSGLGIGFLVTYIVYYLVVWFIAHREIALVWTSHNKRMMLVGVTAAMLIRILPSTRLANLRTPFALILAIVVGIPSLFTVWREFVAGKGVTAIDDLSNASKRTATTH